ncbi:MAG: hypothetical protein H6839_06670 [Planctomycetes bacterium]|nr:hypothetical protein [Planctomycetota bacterium]
MKIWSWMLALLAVACMGATAPALKAQDAGKEEKPAGEAKKDAGGEAKEGEDKEGKEEPGEEDPVANLKAVFKDVDTVIKDVKLTQEDIDSYLKHNDSFDKAMKEDEKFEELKDKSVKEAFDHAIKSDKFKAWAEKEGVKGEDWLRKAVRIMVLNFKLSVGPGIDEQIKSIEDQKAMVESMKEMLSEEEYKEAMDAIEEGVKTLKAMKEIAEGLPTPSEEEKKLIEANREKIDAAGGSDDEDGEDGEEEDDDEEEMG